MGISTVIRRLFNLANKATQKPFNCAAMIEQLDKLGVKRERYTVNSSLLSEGLTLSFDGQVWETYYLERGIKNDLKQFKTEHDACSDLYPQIIQYAKASGDLLME